FQRQLEFSAFRPTATLDSRFRSLLSGINPCRSVENVAVQRGASYSPPPRLEIPACPCHQSGEGRTNASLASVEQTKAGPEGRAQRVIAFEWRRRPSHTFTARSDAIAIAMTHRTVEMRFRPSPE